MGPLALRVMKSPDIPGKFTGQPWAEPATPSDPYVMLLERGYALHELTFGLLDLVVILGPLRRGARWAWWAAWIPMVSCVGYAATFGWQDPTLRTRAFAVPVVLAVALLALFPTVTKRTP